MPLACRAVENNAGNFHRGVMCGEAARDRGRRLRLACDIEHQHDRQIKTRGEIGGGAAPAA